MSKNAFLAKSCEVNRLIMWPKFSKEKSFGDKFGKSIQSKLKNARNLAKFGRFGVFFVNPLNPVQPVTGCDERWPLFQF